MVEMNNWLIVVGVGLAFCVVATALAIYYDIGKGRKR